MKNNERNAGRHPYYGKGVKTEILRVLIISDEETKSKMKADIEKVKEKYRAEIQSNQANDKSN